MKRKHLRFFPKGASEGSCQIYTQLSQNAFLENKNYFLLRMIQYLHSMENRLETGGVDTDGVARQMKGVRREQGAETSPEGSLCPPPAAQPRSQPGFKKRTTEGRREQTGLKCTSAKRMSQAPSLCPQTPGLLGSRSEGVLLPGCGPAWPGLGSSGCCAGRPRDLLPGHAGGLSPGPWALPSDGSRRESGGQPGVRRPQRPRHRRAGIEPRASPSPSPGLDAG